MEVVNTDALFVVRFLVLVVGEVVLCEVCINLACDWKASCKHVNKRQCFGMGGGKNPNLDQAHHQSYFFTLRKRLYDHRRRIKAELAAAATGARS